MFLASWPATVPHSTFREAVRVFTLVPVHHCHPQLYVPKDLLSAGFVFICHDAHCSLLQPPCDGPFCILEAGPKNFIVDNGGNSDWVLFDCLKPADVVPDFPLSPTTAPVSPAGPASKSAPHLCPFTSPCGCSVSFWPGHQAYQAELRLLHFTCVYKLNWLHQFPSWMRKNRNKAFESLIILFGSCLN